MASLVLGTVGAVVGFMAGGPVGAQVGWTIGSAIGAYIDQPTIRQEGPRINDLKVQVSVYGTPIPIIYNRSRVAGNIIWAAQVVEHAHKESSGGKGGGGGTETTTYTYTVSLAVSIASGYIGELSRIWADGEIVYDAPAASTWTADPNYARYVDISPLSVIYGETYTITIDGNAFNYAASATATHTAYDADGQMYTATGDDIGSISAALAVAINASPLYGARYGRTSTFFRLANDTARITIYSGAGASDISVSVTGAVTGLSKVKISAKQTPPSIALMSNGTLTFYHGDELQMPDPTIESYMGAGNVPGYRGQAYIVMRNWDITKYGRIPNFSFEVVSARDPSTPGSVFTVKDIIADISSRVGLQPAEFDCSAIDHAIDGYTLARQMSGRGALEPLTSAFFFGAVESQGKVKFLPAGAAPAVTIPPDDLAAQEAQ